MATKPQVKPLTVRLATLADARSMARLSTQLGYPSSPDQAERRLPRLQRDEEHAVYIAARPDGEVLGWVHVFVSHRVESDPEAEVGGLVVEEDHRRSGAGRLLMERAEHWAREKGLRSIYLRSNIIRKDAHTFYQALGYSVVKTQYAFRKAL